jgi:hypothetical protein
MQASELKTPMDFKSILFATDFSPCATAALPYVVAIAKLYGSRVCEVHVKTRESDFESQHCTPYTMRRLESLVPADAKLWCEPYFVVETGDPAEKILHTAGN